MAEIGGRAKHSAGCRTSTSTSPRITRRPPHAQCRESMTGHQDLSRFPELGQRYLSSQRNVRVLLYEHYRIAYLVNEDKSIDILGVFHGALDITRYQL